MGRQNCEVAFLGEVHRTRPRPVPSVFSKESRGGVVPSAIDHAAYGEYKFRVTRSLLRQQVQDSSIVLH